LVTAQQFTPWESGTGRTSHCRGTQTGPGDDTMPNILNVQPVDAAVRPSLITGAGLDDYTKYLTDESRKQGRVTALAFPRNTAEVCGAVLAAKTMGLSVTVSGARTGITAGAVPDGGMLISLERMNRIRGVRPAGDGSLLVRCEAGVPLSDVQRALRDARFDDTSDWDAESQEAIELLRRTRYVYPPDPTETSAALGGTVACNASGAHSFRYGPTRPYVSALCVVLADGACLRIARGQVHADADGVIFLRSADGELKQCSSTSYSWPSTKNSAGYYSEPEMDLIDLFIGSEGTLGIITEVEVRVVEAPDTSCAALVFLSGEDHALALTVRMRDCRDALGLEAIEYVGPNALQLLRERRSLLGAASGVPSCLPDSAVCGIYIDMGCAAAGLTEALAHLSALISECGADPGICWAALDKDERERLRVFRHALPETVNARIAEIRQSHPTVTKLGTDMAVPDAHLREVIRLYRTHLDDAGLDYVIFGHIGDNHLHVNILPRTPAEYEQGWQLYHRFAEQVVRMGGSPVAEHGVGKLKTEFLSVLFGSSGVDQMLAVKRVFDPEMRLAPGTLFTTSRSSATG